jgi:hypothetical protein
MAVAMGAANATFEQDGEVSIGVTYMTGTLVKIGQHLAQAVAGRERWRWLPYTLLWAGFVAGRVWARGSIPSGHGGVARRGHRRAGGGGGRMALASGFLTRIGAFRRGAARLCYGPTWIPRASNIITKPRVGQQTRDRRAYARDRPCGRRWTDRDRRRFDPSG